MTDVALPPQYLQEKLYTARQDRGLIADIYRQGVRNASEMLVTATGVGRGIQVAGGVCYVPGTKYGTDVQGTYRFVNSTPLNFTLDSAVTYPRIDRIIARVYDGAENNTSDDNRGAVEVLKGIEANGATLDNHAGAQALPFDCLLLAEVAVQIGAGHTLSAASVRDLRLMAAQNSPMFAPFSKAFAAAKRDGVTEVGDGSVTITSSSTATVAGGNAWLTVSGTRSLWPFQPKSISFTPATSGNGYWSTIYLTPNLTTGFAEIGLVQGAANVTPAPAAPGGSFKLGEVWTVWTGVASAYGWRTLVFATPKGQARLDGNFSYGTPIAESNNIGAIVPRLVSKVEGSTEGGLLVDVAKSRIGFNQPGRYLVHGDTDLNPSSGVTIVGIAPLIISGGVVTDTVGTFIVATKTDYTLGTAKTAVQTIVEISPLLLVFSSGTYWLKIACTTTEPLPAENVRSMTVTEL